MGVAGLGWPKQFRKATVIGPPEQNKLNEEVGSNQT